MKIVSVYFLLDIQVWITFKETSIKDTYRNLLEYLKQYAIKCVCTYVRYKNTEYTDVVDDQKMKT